MPKKIKPKNKMAMRTHDESELESIYDHVKYKDSVRNSSAHNNTAHKASPRKGSANQKGSANRKASANKNAHLETPSRGKKFNITLKFDKDANKSLKENDVITAKMLYFIYFVEKSISFGENYDSLILQVEKKKQGTAIV